MIDLDAAGIAPRIVDLPVGEAIEFPFAEWSREAERAVRECILANRKLIFEWTFDGLLIKVRRVA